MPRPITRSPLIFQRFEGLGGIYPQSGQYSQGSGPSINRGPSPLSSFPRRHVLTCIRAWPRETSMKRAMIIVTLWWLAF